MESLARTNGTRFAEYHIQSKTTVRFGRPVNAVAMEGYDGVMVIAKAIEAANSTEPDAIEEAAGPMKNAKTAPPAGGMWLVQAESFDDVMNLVLADPFWPTGLRKSVEILEWTKVYADGKRRFNLQD